MTEEDQSTRSAEEGTGTGTDRPLCRICKVRKTDKHWENKKYRDTCTRCRKTTRGTPLENIKGYRKKALLAITPHVCSYCSFEPLHLCQIHVDHADGNHKNNDIGNLQLLCANCHAFKTWANKDSKQWKYTDPSDKRKES